MNKTKNNFDSVAWCYDFLSSLVFGDKIKKSQTVLFQHINDNSKVLIIGGGTGWVILELMQAKKVSRIDYIELSEKMLQKARSISQTDKNIMLNFIHGDENSIPEGETYDIVISFYFLDLFQKERLEKVISKLVNGLRLEGKLLLADFNVSSPSPLLHKLLVKTMYLFFSLTCRIETKKLIDPRPLLNSYNLHSCYRTSFFNGLIVSEAFRKVR